MKHIKISDQESRSGIMSKEHVEEAVVSMHRNGVLALHNAVSTASIDRLYAKMLEDAEQVKSEEGAYRPVVPPPKRPWLFKDILFNEMVITVTHALLGDGVFNQQYGAN
ncbi:MAG: hypothetical protein VX733_05495 [Candidatus Latescibacterota bacterium]|nr:hypothetical protein [Candidatus Latescibacterota bacterium]